MKRPVTGRSVRIPPGGVRLLAALWLALGVTRPLHAQRGVGGGVSDDSSGLNTARFHALLIAVQGYTDPAIPRLGEPFQDAAQLKRVLTERYRFDPADVTVLRDPKRDRILNELRRLSDQLGPNDNLLIFFAGHGIWDEGSKQSFWLPVDARRMEDAQWISKDDVGRNLRRSKARHILLIADACYAGAELMREVGSTAAMELLYARPSRKAMTSGSKEVVPDRSVFLSYFIQRLVENPKPYLAAHVLFASISEAVMTNSRVVPQFAPIQDVGNEGGDFLFALRDSTKPPPEQAAEERTDSGATRGPTTAEDIVEGENRTLVGLMAKKDVESLARLYQGEMGTPPEWRDKLFQLIRSDLTSARVMQQKTMPDSRGAISSLQVGIEYRDPVVAGTRKATLHLLVRYTAFGSDLRLHSWSLTQKPPM